MPFTEVQEKSLKAKLSGKCVRTREQNGMNLSYVFAAAIILYPIVAIFSPNALVVLLVATSLVLLFDGQNRTGMITVLPRVPVVFIVALFAWSFATVFWSPDPLRSIGV